jgi:hypothetical protein
LAPAGGRAGLSIWDLEGKLVATTVRKGIRGNLAWTEDGRTIGFVDGDGEPCLIWLENIR